MLVIRAGLDQHIVGSRVDPLEVQSTVGVHGGVQADDAARRVGRDPVQVPVALLELVAAPEDGVKQGRGHLADATSDTRYRVDASGAGGDAEAPLEAHLEGRRADFLVERERATRRHDYSVQTIGRELNIVPLLGNRASEGRAALVDELADVESGGVLGGDGRPYCDDRQVDGALTSQNPGGKQRGGSILV